MIFVLAAPPAVLGLVKTRPAREHARAQAVEALRRELGLNAELGDVRVELPTFTLVADDIILDHPRHGRLAKADELRLRPSLWSLLRGEPALADVRIRGATIRLVVREGRLVNAPRSPESSDPEWEYPFDSLHVENARVEVDASPHVRVALSGVGGSLRAEGPRLGYIDLAAEQGFIEHRSGTEHVTALRLNGRLTSREAAVEQLVLETQRASLALRDGVIAFPLGNGYRGRVELSADITHLASLPHGVELPEMDGRLALDAEVEGRRDTPRVRGQVRLKDAHIEGYGLGDRVQLDFVADRNEVRFDNGLAEVIDEGGSAAIDGRLSLQGDMPLQVRVRARDIAFAKLLEQLGVTPDAIVDWNLSGTFELAGSLDPLALEGPLRFRTRDFEITQDAWHAKPKSHVLRVARADIDGRVQVTDEGIRLQHMKARLPATQSRLRADVLLGFDNRLEVQASSEHLQLAEASPLVDIPIGGEGRLEIDVRGSFQMPRVQGDFEVAGFRFNDFPLGDVASDMRLEHEGLAVRFASVQASKRDSRYRVEDLLLDFREGRLRATGALVAQRLRLRDFFHAFHYENDERFEDYGGIVKGRTQVEYTLGFAGDSEFGTLVARGDLDVPEARIGDFQFQDGRLQARWTWKHPDRGAEGAQLALDHLSLHKGDATVNVSGHMGLGGTLDMVAVADKLAVEDVEGLRERFPDLRGRVSVAGTIEGTTELPRANLDVSLAGMAWRDRRLGGGRLYVRLTDIRDPWVQQALQWKPGEPPAKAECGHAREGLARAQWPPDPPLRTIEGPKPALPRPMAYLVCGEALDGALQLDLAIGKTEVHPLRGAVSVDDLELHHFLPRPGPREAPLHARLSGGVRFTDGALLQPHTLAGELHVGQLHVRRQDVSMHNEGPLRASFRRGEVHVAQAVIRGAESYLKLSGGAGATGGLGLSVEGRVDLDLLSSLSSTVSRASGQVALQMNVTGALTQPSIFGQARVRDANLRFASFAEPVEHLEGKVTFSAQRMLFEGFRARVAGGTLTAAGVAELQGRTLDRYQIDLRAARVGLQPEENVDVELGGEATLAWERGQRLPRLHGTLHLTRMHYERAVQMGRTLGDMYRKDRADVERYDPENDRVALDLRVVQDAPMQISNNLIDAELHIQDAEQPFRIVGTDQRYGLVGTLRVGRGVVYFRDSEFDIRQGEITFTDETRIDPHFDVRAVTDIRRNTDFSAPSWHVSLHAKGSRDSFKLDASSDPYLSEEDIALLLTVGMTRSELNQMQTGDLTGTAAMEALATVTGVDEQVRKAVPAIDDFRIASAYSRRTNRTEPQLFVGKRIADRVRLNAATGLSEARDFRTSVELQLDERTSVEAVYNNQRAPNAAAFGNVGVDLRWRLEFE